MAVGHNQVSVTDVRAEVIPSDHDGQYVSIINHGVEPVYLGNDDVTAENGYRLPEEDSVSLSLGPGETVHAVMAAEETGTVSYISTMNE